MAGSSDAVGSSRRSKAGRFSIALARLDARLLARRKHAAFHVTEFEQIELFEQSLNARGQIFHA